MLVLIATLKAQPGRSPQVAQALRGMVAASRREAGTLAYGFTQEQELFTVTEYYRDETAHRAHMESPALKAFLAEVSGLLTEAPGIQLSQLQEGFGFGEQGVQAVPDPRHFIVSTTFRVPMEELGEAVQRHRAFLQLGYDQGLLLVSGVKTTRTGGILVARADSMEALQAYFSQDPYALEGLADHRFQEFLPIKRQAFLEAWIQGA